MYQCPNCSGNLKFYIPSQMLRCDFCQTEIDPYAVTKDRDAIEDTFFETTVFTCPQCGGELMSTDNEATSFCSFCGASTILDSRLSQEKRPDYIIPFEKTKEDCKNAYVSMMKRAIYAPSALRDQKHIDGFRGIYMPYWIYHITQKGPAEAKGKKTYRRGNYDITDHYNLHFNVDGDYKGLSRDASSSFADNLSEAIAPYHIVKMKKFTPSFLSGFYADTADVEEELYRDDVEIITNDATLAKIRKVPEFAKYTVEMDPVFAAQDLNSRFEDITGAMFPVWFLSYRNGNRISYATVNGQTGKVAADIPVDPKKYMIGSLLLALPIFLLLNFILTVTPVVSLLIVSGLAAIANLLYATSLKQILKRDTGQDDKGYMARKAQDMGKVHSGKSPKFKKAAATRSGMSASVFAVVFTGVLISIVLSKTLGTMPTAVWAILGFIVNLCASISGAKTLRQLTIAGKRYGYIGGLAAAILATGIVCRNPVQDHYYYIASIVAIVAVFLAISDLIHYYNILATRKLPQFERQGGDDRA